MSDIENVNTDNVKSRRGFASLTKEKLKEMSARGGKAVHAKGTAHHWTSEEARIAGAKGGAASRTSRQNKRQPSA